MEKNHWKATGTACLVSFLAILGTSDPWPIGVYTLFRWALAGTCAWLAQVAEAQHRSRWMYAFGLTGAFFFFGSFGRGEDAHEAWALFEVAFSLTTVVFAATAASASSTSEPQDLKAGNVTRSPT